MKKLLLVLTLVGSIGYTTNSFAQSLSPDGSITADEIILDNKDQEGLTTIEIKEGKLFIDGKKISELDKNTTLKIIKKNTFSDTHNFDFGTDALDSPFNPNRGSYGKVSKKVMLGVQTTDAFPGAEIKNVMPGSAAEKAGFKNGDIIIAVDGSEIRTSTALAEIIGKYKQGDKVKIQIERNGQTSDLTAHLDKPSAEKIPFNNFPGTGRFSLPFQNLERLYDMQEGGTMVFSENSKPVKLGMEIEESEDGLEILSVDEKGAAFNAGIRKGDKIKTIEGEEIESLEEIRTQIIQNKEKKKLHFGIQRAGTIKTLPVVLPRAKRRAQF